MTTSNLCLCNACGWLTLTAYVTAIIWNLMESLPKNVYPSGDNCSVLSLLSLSKNILYHLYVHKPAAWIKGMNDAADVEVVDFLPADTFFH